MAYIEPSILTDTSPKVRRLVALARQRGLTMRRAPGREAVRVTGPHIDVVAASVHTLTLSDLQPSKIHGHEA